LKFKENTLIEGLAPLIAILVPARSPPPPTGEMTASKFLVILFVANYLRISNAQVP